MFSGGSPWTMVVLAMFGKFSVACSFAILYVYASELMPTVVRAETMGIASFVAGIGLLIFPYVLATVNINPMQRYGSTECHI